MLTELKTRGYCIEENVAISVKFNMDGTLLRSSKVIGSNGYNHKTDDLIGPADAHEDADHLASPIVVHLHFFIYIYTFIANFTDTLNQRDKDFITEMHTTASATSSYIGYVISR